MSDSGHESGTFGLTPCGLHALCIKLHNAQPVDVSYDEIINKSQSRVS